MSVENTGSVMGIGANLMSFLPMVFIFAIFYFFLIRPQLKRQREAQQMISELKRGDKVVAAGGLYGVISKIEDNMLYIEVAEGVRVKALKASVTEVLSNAAIEEVKSEKADKPSAKPAKLAAESKPKKKAVKKS